MHPGLRKAPRAGVREGIKGRVIFSYIEEDTGTEAPLADLHALRLEASADYRPIALLATNLVADAYAADLPDSEQPS